MVATPAQNYDIKDPALAEVGQKRMAWAARDIPVPARIN